ncbi:unnamed protein product [Durusdinium trenchii]|uniref:Uncharacterized protein n=2 Tax=Durusdinium trenchii TaxID=1381693 RepID=A0ABP0R3Q4_9DINO
MTGAAPLRCEGEAFVLLGPSAAGKSTLLPKMEVPSGALVMDGSFIRQESQMWRKALGLARCHGLTGFSDHFEECFKPPMDKLKSSLLEKSIRQRANLIIPDSASNFPATKRMLEQLLKAGYRLRFAAVYGDEEELLRRGRARASQEGKQFTGKNWRASVEAILQLQDYLETTGLVKDSGLVTVLDNSGPRPEPMSHADLQARLCTH